ncbi:alginate export family protein [Nitrospinae bacterium]|nr:alginate export family protein [Nitrospinota bacterium]
MMVVAFFVSTEIAKAADVTFSGQIRTRWEAVEQFGGASTQEATSTVYGGNNETDDLVFSSVRLAAKANINETTKAFIQLQSTRNWGETGTGTIATGAGEGNASGTVNDNDSSVGVHQAYMEFKNFLNLPMGFDAKIGRQEVLLDGWRLFGNTIWTPGMQSHDMVRLDHKHDNVAVTLGYILHAESGRSADPADNNDQDTWFAYTNIKGVLGGQFSGYYIYWDDQTGTNQQAHQFHTIGGRQAGKFAGFDYRAEFYYQTGGENGGWGGRAATGAGSGRDPADFDMDAYMFGVRVGKTATSMASKPSLTLFYDYLSGTSDNDARNGTVGSFNTIYDTGHKYYGLIDMFLGVGGGGAKGTQGMGLQDLAIKGKIKPMAGWTLKADYHWFWTAESVSANRQTNGLAAPTAGHDYTNLLGNELDITAVTKMNANTKVMIGYSNFTTSTTMRTMKALGANDINWGYVQFDVKF